MLYTHVPSFFRTKGSAKGKAQFYSALPKRQDVNVDDMQTDRTLSMWTNPSYKRILKTLNIFTWDEH